MRRGSDAFGRSVVTYDTGERIARVEDLIFAQSSNQLVGLLVTEAGLFSSARVIPFHNIQAFGPDVIVVSDKSTVKRANQLPEIKQSLKQNNVLRGTRIVTTNGHNLGTMVDLYFDEQTGAIEGYEVSGGLFADAYSGRSFVPAPQTLKIGRNFAFVPPEIAEMMEEQVGGIKGAFQTAGGKLQETTQIANQRMQETTQTASDKLQQTTQVVGDQLQDTRHGLMASLTDTVVDPKQQKAFVIGKIFTQNIIAPNGTQLIAQGQPVTPLIAEEAEELGVLEQLYRATGGSLSEPARQKLQETTQAAHERLQETTQTANARLQQGMRSSIAALTNTVIDPTEQKTFVIGKTVSQAIVAPDGTQLIDQNEQVTPLVAEVAYSLGVLDQLYRAAGGSITVNLSRAANAALASQIVEQAMGRRVREAVRTSDGIFIAAPGQIVTEQVVERARIHHKELELLNAVGLTPSEAARSSTSGFLSGTGEQLRGSATQAQENVGNLWERIKEKAANLQRSSAQTLEKQRIKQALGRPVTRVILAPQDDVILNVGELITHQAIESARQGDVLDILLSSVYNKQPELLAKELRAPERGEASLEKRDQVSNGKENSYELLRTFQS